MVNISPIERTIGKGMNYTAKNWFAGQLRKGRENPAKYAGIMLVTSLVSKDAVNCYYYVTQSLHNKKIPEEKRGFVASLDLMNGILNVVGQIGVFYLLEKTAKNVLFKKFIGKRLDTDVLKQHAKKVVDGSKEKLNLEKVHQALIKNHGSGSKQYKALETGFGLFFGFIVTAAFSKRILSPLLGTPMASWYRDKFLNNKKSENQPAEDKAAMKAATIQPKYDNEVNKTQAKKSIIA